MCIPRGLGFPEAVAIVVFSEYRFVGMFSVLDDTDALTGSLLL